MQHVMITNISPDELRSLLKEVVQEELKQLPAREAPDRWITVKEACRLIGGHSKKTDGCSEVTFWRLRKERNIETRYIGSSPRFRESDIRELAEKIAT